jgi:serine-type D-Ala-D-Ala endopeptidase (penicillin-binding protein 7)
MKQGFNMFKFALGAILSLLFLSFSASAQDGGDTAAAPKKTSHKSRTHRKDAHHSVAESHDRLIKRVMMVHGKRKVVYQRVSVAAAVPAVASMGELAGLNLTHDSLDLKSNVALVIDQANSEILFEKNAGVALPIASITKLMTGLIVVQAKQDMDEVLTVTDEDIDREKHTSSRLRVGAQLTRANMLHIALMSSENRAASALGRNYPGGRAAFVEAMNAKAAELGMAETHYVDSNGLSSHNVASARDLAKLVMVAHQEPLLRQYTTDTRYVVAPAGKPMQFANTNRLVGNPDWEIGLQKTGFINEAGRCLVMQAIIQGRAVIMVFLDAKDKSARAADAGRMRKWLEALKPPGIS